MKKKKKITTSLSYKRREYKSLQNDENLFLMMISIGGGGLHL